MNYTTREIFNFIIKEHFLNDAILFIGFEGITKEKIKSILLKMFENYIDKNYEIILGE